MAADQATNVENVLRARLLSSENGHVGNKEKHCNKSIEFGEEMDGKLALSRGPLESLATEFDLLDIEGGIIGFLLRSLILHRHSQIPCGRPEILDCQLD